VDHFEIPAPGDPECFERYTPMVVKFFWERVLCLRSFFGGVSVTCVFSVFKLFGGIYPNRYLGQYLTGVRLGPVPAQTALTTRGTGGLTTGGLATGGTGCLGT